MDIDDRLIRDTGCCDEQPDTLEIKIEVFKNDEYVLGNTALNWESAEELLGKLQRAYENK